MFPGQNYVPRMLQGSHMENKMLRPPGNLNASLPDGSSRKRKSVDMDQPAPLSVSTYECSDPFGLNLQQSSLGVQIENQAYELNSNQRKSTGPETFMHQRDKDQFLCHSSYPGPLVTSNMNFLSNANHNCGNDPSPLLPPQSSAYGGPFGSTNMQAAKGVVKSIWQAQACDVVGARHNQLLNNGGVNDIVNRIYNSSQSELQFVGTRSFCIPMGEISENRGKGDGDGLVREIEKRGESDVKSLNYSLPVVSPISCRTHKSIETSQTNYSACASLSSDEKVKLDDGKAALTVAEKLWEGYLQLSSAVTVSSVAYFESGEKLLNTNWYNSVEVKGKVRLEAFEKYIQDLPCSLNKGLMVISICLKEGSSDSSLKSMTEVARGYTRGKRVGFAHLSREIHLYICPFSEAIIMILSKYGFFKGMPAIKDKQDSMIGCVIWRKSRTLSDSVAKNPVTKSAAPSKSSDEDSDLEDSPLTRLVQEIVAPLSGTLNSTEQADVENGGKDSKCSPSKTEIEVGDSFTCTQGPESSQPSSHHIAQGDLTMVNTRPINCLTEQPIGNFNFQNPIIPPPRMVKEKTTFDDDNDDLPEFDFIIASKHSLSNLRNPSKRETVGNRFTVAAAQKMDFPVQSAPIEQVNPLQIPAFTPLERRDGVQNKIAISAASNTVFPSRKSLFDDDDMPEWCPPEHHNRSTGTNRPDALPAKFPVPNFQNSPRSSPFSPRGFSPVGQFNAPQPRPLQRGPSSEIGPHPNSILGPPPGFIAKLPLDRADKQGWGPR